MENIAEWLSIGCKLEHKMLIYLELHLCVPHQLYSTLLVVKR